MIPAVTSITAASTSTAAARHAPADDQVATASATASVPASASTPASGTEGGAVATVRISEQASVQAASQPALKPDWTFKAADGNKDGQVTIFEQQVYDFRHYPSSLEKAKAYNEAGEEPKPDAGLTA